MASRFYYEKMEVAMTELERGTLEIYPGELKIIIHRSCGFEGVEITDGEGTSHWLTPEEIVAVMPILKRFRPSL